MSHALKLGSLFDGSGTAPLAASMCGIDPIWASEIEPYPIAVTKARFPQMQHLGSILDINGGKVVPVDIICGGSPCQDLSVAGKQAGIHNGERSHLFFEMTRIIKEMRGATDGKYPRYIVWENVPGAFSSNKGEDFLAVLQAFAEIADPDVHVPEPESKGGRLAWKYAGEVVGDGWSIAWRTVDAQYWGVPQRRRRIYLVADLGSERAGEILFERTGVSGDSESCGAQGQKAAGGASGSTGRSSVVKRLNPWDSQTIRQYDANGLYPALTSNATGGQNRQGVVYPAVARTLTAEHDASPCIDRGQNITVYEPSSMLAENWAENDVKNALRAGESKSAHAVVCAADCRNMSPHEEISGTLQAKSGGGYSLNYQNPVVYSSGSFGSLSEGVGTLGTGTRATAEMVAVFDARGNGNGETVPTLTGDHQNRVTDYTALAVGNGQMHNITMAEVGNTLDCMHDQQAVLHNGKPPRKYIVRRLTPLECCRLQGFPDYWMEGVPGSDSAKYKMWGNGMALPNMLFVMKRIAAMQ